MESISINLTVYHWFQAIMHGKDWPSYQFRFSAQASKTEELKLTGVGRIRDLQFSLSIMRGEQKIQKPLKRGLGVLGYYPPRPAGDDIDAMESFIGGWFWLDEGTYDEAWVQVRDNRYDDCIVNLEIAPVEYDTSEFVWNVRSNKVISILRAGLMFKRSLKAYAPLSP